MESEKMFNKTLQLWKEKEWLDINNISDGYHTFWELYEHRVFLYIALCKSIMRNPRKPWYVQCIRSKIHEDGLNVWEEWGMFLLCVHTNNWQVSYHIDNKYWQECSFAITEEKATLAFDWHTSKDVLKRLLEI